MLHVQKLIALLNAFQGKKENDSGYVSSGVVV